MQGPDFKVGKTDIIDSNGNRVVTTTTNENTLDGKSIWTIKQEFDYDNDGKMDAFRTTTQTYDADTGKLLNETIKSNESARSTIDGKPSVENNQYLYETKTGNLVKVNNTIDFDSDGTVDFKETTKYRYNEKGEKISEETYVDNNQRPNRVYDYEYHTNGKVKTESIKLDHDADGKFNNMDAHFRREYDKDGNIISNTEIYTEATVVSKYDKKGHRISKEVIEKPVASEEPAKAEEKPQYELPTYKPYESDKKHPPMMGV